MNETREELLENLYYVKSTMIKMQNTLTRYIELERAFRAKQKGIETKGAGNKAKITMIAVCSTILAFCLILSPFAGGSTEVICAAVGFAFICMTQGKKDQKPFKTLRKIAFLVVILCFSERLFGILMAGLTSPLMLVLIVVLAGIIAAEYVIINRVNRNVAARNEAIEESNRQVQQQREAYYNQYAALQQELQSNTASWYPPDYYNMEAVNFFINAVRNSRAGTVSELVNMFEATKQHQEIAAYQKRQEQKLAQLVEGQQNISDQLSFTNLMQVASFIQRGAYYRGNDTADMIAHGVAGYAVGNAIGKKIYGKKK